MIARRLKMITNIDNNQRKFLVQSLEFAGPDIFCNLKNIPNVLIQAFKPNEQYKIYEFWNRKLKVCSKKHLNEMFVANQINFKIN